MSPIGLLIVMPSVPSSIHTEEVPPCSRLNVNRALTGHRTSLHGHVSTESCSNIFSMQAYNLSEDKICLINLRHTELK